MPQEPQPSSGWGHSLSRPHEPHRTVTHVSDHVRCVSSIGGADRSSGGWTGLPHAQGKTGAV
ncbi:hypothetical protein [Streptomyces sp. NPDC047014]|uniref:hypothetical protein n=1 Tax=Streptomyces sp. NPDC047014 TaxID=3155736 RepID=UPI0033E3E414